MPTIEQLEKLLKIDPEDPFVHYGIGQEHAKQGAHERAIECFDRVIELDEAYCYAYYFKAISLKALGQPDDAVDAVNTGIAKAQACADGKALSELSTLLQTLR